MSTGIADAYGPSSQTLIFLDTEDSDNVGDAQVTEFTDLTHPADTADADGLDEHMNVATQGVANLGFEDLSENAYSVNHLMRAKCQGPLDDCVVAISPIREIHMGDSANAVSNPGHMSYDISATQQPMSVHQEESFPGMSNLMNPKSPSEIVYWIVQRGSRKGRDKLYDNQGFSYTIARKNEKFGTTWICTVRNKKHVCSGNVRQNGDNFVILTDHNHAPMVRVENASTGSRNSKDDVRVKPCEPALEPDKKILKQELPNMLSCPSPPDFHSLDRTANPGNLTTRPSTRSRNLMDEARAKSCEPALEPDKKILRQELPNMLSCPGPPDLHDDSLDKTANPGHLTTKPSDPKDIDFELEQQYLPHEFFRFDIKGSSYRHIGFATKQQVRFLRKAKIWYIDETFCLVEKPFIQLLTISIFVKSGECVKQVPVFFVLMSRRRTKDYVKVFENVKSKCGRRIHLTKAVLDFEVALWKGLQESFPNAKRSGCAFHYKQAIYGQVQKLGLAKSYAACKGTSRLIKKLMSLCLMPHSFMRTLFCQMVQANEGDERIQQLFDYVRKTLMEHSVWKRKNVSVYGSPIRTNNDCKGWHSRIDEKGQEGTSFYFLIELLQSEASGDLSTAFRLVSEKKLMHCQEKKYKIQHKRIFALWRSYKDGRISARKLLSALSKIQ